MSLKWWIGLTVLLAGCATVERATKTRTYVIATGQLERIRQELGIQPCLDGETALAMTIESAQGGATVTVRCQ